MEEHARKKSDHRRWMDILLVAFLSHYITTHLPSASVRSISENGYLIRTTAYIEASLRVVKLTSLILFIGMAFALSVRIELDQQRNGPVDSYMAFGF